MGIELSATVLITGGARGLGFVFANLYAARGARVMICSRTEQDLEEAVRKIKAAHPAARVRGYVCDVSNPVRVQEMVASIEKDFGPVDILVNNAGWIAVSPVETLNDEDFVESLNSNLWGMIRTTLAVIPRMKERKQGKILNVTSVGGVVPGPHLLPYTTAKFGAVGFSTGLAFELRNHGITVTTAVPSLMRTGSFHHARFKGNHLAEMTWFSLSSSLPGLSHSAKKAAKKMMEACDRGDRFVWVGLPARLAQLGFGLFPELVLKVLGVVDQLLPQPKGRDRNRLKPGQQVQRETGKHPQTRFGDAAAKKWNETNPDRQLH